MEYGNDITFIILYESVNSFNHATYFYYDEITLWSAEGIQNLNSNADY